MEEMTLTNSQADPSQTHQESEEEVTLGQRLRVARESQQLTLADVAKSLCFTQQRVIQIENDDYTHAATKSYARGYLCAYAKLLTLPLNEILVQFDALNLSEHVSQKKMRVAVRDVGTVPGHYFRWISCAVVIVLFVLVALWWYGLGRPMKQVKPLVTAKPNFAPTTTNDFAQAPPFSDLTDKKSLSMVKPNFSKADTTVNTFALQNSSDKPTIKH